MFKQISNLAGNEIYLLVSLLIFIVFFIIATFMLFRMKKTHIAYMSELPVENDNQTNA
ncbi:hypothetical protein Pedsa_0369 [Pseudopedobacter saltans DSM 12145]|uniref:CcoQ/FixQ family Cbb3-type cytochrome c oxidase assembly chaperone n=1 Tax=Pseudopedobacter saltans (strain ATCC 51119 / DSM 12145 / JCM 21818 / CCUG 39354 / LMG 10337 / NBRC 100064 / NCIMB 13643) TaxID=762903 RepID=F0S534_PSESL|nr:hypothetical protein [Pseudopedobacter saltans]ADY50951.1 hypothetical protein Pedsa_0369 [Pseudopedobacter saltans DSM 12145]